MMPSGSYNARTTGGYSMTCGKPVNFYITDEGATGGGRATREASQESPSGLILPPYHRGKYSNPASNTC